MAIRNNLDDIAKIDIEISTPGSSEESFSSLLIVVTEPDEEGTSTIGDTVILISKATDLVDYGFTTKHQAHVIASVAFSQTPTPEYIYVVVRKQAVDEEGQPKVDENEKPIYESMADCLNRANEAGGWYGIGLSKEFLNKEDLEDTMNWTESNAKLFGFTFTENTLPVDLKNYFRTFAAYGGGVPNVTQLPDENYYITIGMMAKCFGYEPGSETWALKPLASVFPCKLSATMKKYCNDNCITYFTTYTKKNITSAKGGKVLANEWIDTIRFRDWLKNDMQERIFNLLVLNQKIPYGDNGITSIEGKMEESLKAGQDSGGIAQTEYDEDDNEIPAYVITVPNSSQFTDEQKSSRTLVGCKFKAKLAGAIQVVEVSGNLVYV